jgi:hypothetical protein
MWKMLIDSNEAGKIDTSNIKADDYIISPLDRPIASAKLIERINIIQAHFHFQDGLIIKHTDDFDVWKWSKQALGIKGVLFYWTGYMQKKIHEKAISSLTRYKEFYKMIETLKIL